MCYAIPGRVERVSGGSALIDYDGVKKTANISLLEQVDAGDYVLVHAGFAIQKVDRGAAEESIKLVKDIVENGKTTGKSS